MIFLKCQLRGLSLDVLHGVYRQLKSKLSQLPIFLFKHINFAKTNQPEGKKCANLNLIGPSSKVTQCGNRHSYVCLEGQSIHSTRVKRFNSGKFFLVFFHQVSQPSQHNNSEKVRKSFTTT